MGRRRGIQLSELGKRSAEQQFQRDWAGQLRGGGPRRRHLGRPFPDELELPLRDRVQHQPGLAPGQRQPLGRQRADYFHADHDCARHQPDRYSWHGNGHQLHSSRGRLLRSGRRGHRGAFYLLPLRRQRDGTDGLGPRFRRSGPRHDPDRHTGDLHLRRHQQRRFPTVDRRRLSRAAARERPTAAR